MRGTSSTISLRRWAAMAATLATTASGALLAGAPPASATTSYTYQVTSMSTGIQPRAVAVNSATHKAYVANTGDGTVSVIDGATHTVTSVNVGAYPDAVAVDQATNMIYVAHSNDGTMSVIDGATNTVTSVPIGLQPYAVAVNEVTNMIYVTNYTDSTVTVVNGATDTAPATVNTTLTVGDFPQQLAIDTATNMIYVANSKGSYLSVIDGATNTLAAPVNVLDPRAVAIDPGTHKVYATIAGQNVAVINGGTHTAPATLAATVNIGVNPDAIAVNPATHKVYVTSTDAGSVSVIDSGTSTVTQVTVGAIPGVVAVDPEANIAYTANFSGNSVSVIDGDTNTVTNTLTVGPGPYAIAVDPEANMIYTANFNGNSVSVIARTALTTATLTASASPRAGSPATLTAGIAPNPGGGSVGFTDGGAPITGCTSQPVDPTTGEATCVATFPSSGLRTIGASYTGTSGYAASTASPLTLTVAAVPTPAPAVSRVAGADRYATAAAASATRFGAGGAGAVVLATGADYPDGLVGVPLAVAKNAPLLLTTGATLPTVTKDELVRVLPTGRTVYVLGSTAAVPANITAQLTGLGYTVTRLGGADRYATAVKVADALGDPATVLLASGANYPDALTAGPAAAKTGGAVLLTTETSLGATTSAYLAAHPGTVYAIGGPAAAADPAATAVTGADRYTTAAAVATRFFPAPSHVGVATGTNYPDALSGGALAAANDGPVLLADTAHTDAATGYLSAARAGLNICWIFGDTNAVRDPVADTITTTLHP